MVTKSVQTLCFLFDIHNRQLRSLALQDFANKEECLIAQKAHADLLTVGSFASPIVDYFFAKYFKDPMLKKYIVRAFMIFTPIIHKDPRTVFDTRTRSFEEEEQALIEAAHALSLEYAPFASESVSDRRLLLEEGVSLQIFVTTMMRLCENEHHPCAAKRARLPQESASDERDSPKECHCSTLLDIRHILNNTKSSQYPIAALSSQIAAMQQSFSSVESFAQYAQKRSVEDILLNECSFETLLKIISEASDFVHTRFHEARKVMSSSSQSAQCA